MKKLAMALALTATMAMASVCAAAGEGSILNKDQKVAETMYAGLNGSSDVTYEQVAEGLNENGKKLYTQEAYTNLQKAIKEKVGKVKEVNFVLFQRLGNADVLVYAGEAPNDKIVRYAYICDKNGKINEVKIDLLNKQQPKKEEKPAEAPAEE